jgi:hypothetical protein
MISVLSVLFCCAMAAAQCNLVIGYSQVGQTNGGWFVAGGAFEEEVVDDDWQLLWNGGAGVDMWQNPNYTGWSNSLISPCASNSIAPVKVLLSISGPYGADVQRWKSAIDSTITVIKSKYPSVAQIILQPVVGGPGHATCMLGNDSVRASWQHKYIDQAIALVVADKMDVIAGYSPEVDNCNDYADALGHLDPTAATAIGREIGQYYAASTAATPNKTVDKEACPLKFSLGAGQLILFSGGAFTGGYTLSIISITGRVLWRQQGEIRGPMTIPLESLGAKMSKGACIASLQYGAERKTIFFAML